MRCLSKLSQFGLVPFCLKTPEFCYPALILRFFVSLEGRQKGKQRDADKGANEDSSLHGGCFLTIYKEILHHLKM